MSAAHVPPEEGSARVEAYALPLSSLLDAGTHQILLQQAKESAALGKLCPYKPTTLRNAEEAIAFRHCYDEHLHHHLIAKHKARYQVEIEPSTIDGVPVEVFTPAAGLSADNCRRVLINLHGGGFIMGGRWVGQIESIPIAAVGRAKVVSVDYRMAPEHRFPAASEDVAKVYRWLLREHRPESIGIYGCSAGAVLTAETVAWLQNQNLPRPGAVGMLAAAASYWGEGDSGHFHAARSGISLSQLAVAGENPYFEDVDANDSLAFPLRSAERLAKFPPSLLIAATRDFALSSVVHTHSLLTELGVKAELHVWEGLDHAFHYSPDLQQSRQLYAVTAKFFDTHLLR